MNQPFQDSETPKKLSNDDLAIDRTELAKYRSRAAADRTLMAWIRTSLSLIGFGFGIPTITTAIEKIDTASHLNPIRFSVIVGLCFISVGMFGLALGLKEHRKVLKQIESDRYTYENSQSAEIVAVALLVIGLLSFIGVLIKSLNF
ncbi:hypothetical protein GM3708_1046 [Geminocystis sp. NIES-3708]|uniref:YidH family protein n=1 Tax=Geminocystis sp. NIES-3708 TaxID=1615909 RepID=UPI0005FCD6D1|nr:DUF202 domain-containing protein [Geminocystis sp. NIES-3708]BAQ60640.1 hypothetical protein GM3708_1046 [Geminocystis sp. NIES-3708]